MTTTKFQLAIDSFVSSLPGRKCIKKEILKARNGTLDKILRLHEESKTLYVPIPKAANSSIIRLLWIAYGIDEQDQKTLHYSGKLPDKVLPPLSSFTNSYIETALKSKEWFRFTFVRNPYSRLISAYKDKIVNVNHNRNFLKRMNWQKDRLPSFDEFIDDIITQNIMDMDWHWRPQSSLVMPGLINIDYIGKVENFNEDILPVINRLNITDSEPGHNVLKPINNSSSSSKEALLTPESAEKIYIKYKSDFEEFDYSECSAKSYL